MNNNLLVLCIYVVYVFYHYVYILEVIYTTCIKKWRASCGGKPVFVMFLIISHLCILIYVIKPYEALYFLRSIRLPNFSICNRD